MKTTLPFGTVSTKWEESFGASVSEDNTMRTVYAGPHSLVYDGAAGEGEYMWMSGMWPPLATPSLMRASETSQDENCDSADEASKLGWVAIESSEWVW